MKAECAVWQISNTITTVTYSKKQKTKHQYPANLTKVSKFELSSVADEEVLWFQVSVKNVPLVDIGQASQQLKQEQLKRYKWTMGN